MSYREHPPPPMLVPWLACTWERHSDGRRPVRVLPDGCVDVVWIQGEGTQIVGANTTAFLVALPLGTYVVGARLCPGAAPSLLGVAGEAMRDAHVAIESEWGSEGARLAAALEAHADPLDGLRAALLERAVRADRPDRLVRAAVTRLARPDAGVAVLAGDLGVSERSCADGCRPLSATARNGSRVSCASGVPWTRLAPART